MTAKYTVQELVDLQIIEKPLDGNHGSIHPTSKDYVEDGIPFIMASDLSNGLVNFSSCKFITEKQANTLRKGFSIAGDILLSHKATIGRTATVQENKYPFLVLTPQVTYYRVKDKQKLNNLYLKYYFDSQYFQSILQQWAGSGSTRAYIGITEQLKLPIILPDIDTQNEIVEIINGLDQKIQLNTQINQTLEQIAQALFKSWFVDFDPVRAKVQALSDGLSLEQAELAAMQAISGKTAEELTALSQAQPDRYAELAETAKAFPCEMVEVDGVEVPKGWEVKRIEEVIKKIPVGKKYSSKTAFSEGLVPILDQGRSGVIGYHNDEPGVKASIEDPIIVFANHTCYMRLISYDFSAIQNVFAFKGKECDVFWVYLATLGKQEFVEYKGHFPDFLIKEIIVPPKKLTALFRKYVKESFSKIFINDRENSSLAKIRDLLLPKLLNGEI